MDFFEGLGITVDEDLSSFEKEKKKYEKINPSLFETVNQSLRLVPTLFDAKYYNSDTYRVVFDKGYGVLQKSTKYPGMFLANVVEKGTNNKIKDTARLQALSNAPQVLSGAFNAMSLITGQYYMSKIDTRLKKLEKGVEAVQDYLEDSRRSELYGNLDFLKEVQGRLRFYSEDTTLATSTLAAVQTIKINSLGNLTFYREQIAKIEGSLTVNDKVDVILTNINDMYRLISEYWFALQLYCFSSYLEPQVTHNADAQLIRLIADDIESKSNIYEKQYKAWKDVLDTYVENAKAFEENQIYKFLKEMDLIPTRIGSVALVQGMAKIFGTIANKLDTKKKDKNHEIVIEEIKKKAPNTEIESVMEMRKELLLLEQIYSDRIEIVSDRGEMYYRILTESVQEGKKEKSVKTPRKAKQIV